MEFADQVKSSLDIVNVIGEYVRLKKVGSRYTGLCPFHSEKTPSFSVNPQHQFYKCFGCGEAGDVFAFVMKHDGLGFFEAMKLLAERNGIPLPKRAGYVDDDAKARAAIYRMHELAAVEFQRLLAEEAGAEARRYLEKRGVSQASVEQFGLGFAPRNGGVTRLLQKNGFNPDEIDGSGLALKRDDGSLYDRFRGRLMFPIHNESGKVIAFGGRALAADDNPKYLNSPETKIYRKSSVLYNLHRAKDGIRTADRVVLVEGYMDVIGVVAAGPSEVIASCGTALTSQQAQALRRQTANIVVNFDADAAGAKAAERSIQLLLAEGMKVRILTLDGGLDPDEYCRERGAEAYSEQVNQARGYFHWLAERARARFDMRTGEGRFAAFQVLVPAIQTLPEKLERMAIADDVAGYLGLERGLVLDSFRKMVSERKADVAPPAPDPIRPTDRILLSLLLAEEDVRNEFMEYLKGLPSLRAGRAGRVYEALITLHEAGGPCTYSSLHARLSPPEQEILASAVLQDGSQESSPSREEGFACLEALVEEERGRERNAMKVRIREAERTGNMPEALRLSEELARLQTRA